MGETRPARLDRASGRGGKAPFVEAGTPVANYTDTPSGAPSQLGVSGTVRAGARGMRNRGCASPAGFGDNTAGKQCESVPPMPPDNTGGKQARGEGSTGFNNCRKTEWGGARNRAGRQSDCLSLAQCRKLMAAPGRAAAIGLPFNRFVTVHWEHLGVPDERAAWATGRLLKLAGDWVRTRGGRLAWEWVRENGDRKGSHVHLLCHVPAGCEWGPMQRGWLRRITRQPYRARGIRTARIGGTARSYETAPAVYWLNLETVVAYMLKGAGPIAADGLELARLEAGGRIIGKRAGLSQNLSGDAHPLK